MVSPLRLRWVKGVCVFRRNLPPALLAAEPGSSTCHCGNTGLERTPNKSQYAKLTLEKKIFPPLQPGFELATFQSRVQHFTNKLSRLLEKYSVCIKVRKHTGNNCLHCPFLTKFRTGQSARCPCQTRSRTTEHLLQARTLKRKPRVLVLVDGDPPVARKLFGSLDDLRCTTRKTRVSI